VGFRSSGESIVFVSPKRLVGGVSGRVWEFVAKGSLGCTGKFGEGGKCLSPCGPRKPRHSVSYHDRSTASMGTQGREGLGIPGRAEKNGVSMTAFAKLGESTRTFNIGYSEALPMKQGD